MPRTAGEIIFNNLNIASIEFGKDGSAMPADVRSALRRQNRILVSATRSAAAGKGVA